MAETAGHGAIHRKSSGERPNRTKRHRAPPPLRPRDLISALPDAVIHHIFSFLPLEDVVKTSVLSKRWRSAWTTTTHLVFGGEIEDRLPPDFSSIVDSVLSQCTSPTVKRFHITGFEYDHAYSSKVDLWLCFAEQRRVEDLRLWLPEESPCVYPLPRFLYCLSRLLRLDVSGCCFSLGTTIRWPGLKVLSIENAELSDDILGRIFRGSPVLESLELWECWGADSIIIDSLSVKKLVLVHPVFSTIGKISAPHLLSLRVSGTWHDHSMFRLEDISSLAKARLNFDILTGDKRMCYDLLKELFEKLGRVPRIVIGGWCLKVLSLLEMEGVPSPLSKCQNLTLHTSVSQWDLPGIAYMLRSSQCLEKLVIDLIGHPLMASKLDLDDKSQERFNFDDEDFLCSRKGNFECLAKALKRVEIIGDEANAFASRRLLALIKFLLGDALVLEKLIIKAKLPTRHGQKHLEAAVLSKLLGVSKNALGCRRASKNAEVIFDYPLEEMPS